MHSLEAELLPETPKTSDWSVYFPAATYIHQKLMLLVSLLSVCRPVSLLACLSVCLSGGISCRRTQKPPPTRHPWYLTRTELKRVGTWGVGCVPSRFVTNHLHPPVLGRRHTQIGETWQTVETLIPCQIAGDLVAPHPVHGQFHSSEPPHHPTRSDPGEHWSRVLTDLSGGG